MICHFRALAVGAVVAVLLGGVTNAAAPARPQTAIPQAAAKAAKQGPQQAVTQKKLADCKAELRARGGGWCEMRVSGAKPGISSVFYQVQRDHKIDRRLRGWNGPNAVLTSWCSSAFDRNNLVFYFSCGGHAGYGGNEWYSFDLEAGRWERLTDPSPLTYLYLDHVKNGVRDYRWQPDIRVVPSAAHNYDGVFFRQVTGTIYYLTHSQFDGHGARNVTAAELRPVEEGGRVLGGKISAQYEFNPSKTEVRNGLKPLSWRRVGTEKGFIYARSMEKTNGDIFMGGNHVIYQVFFGPNGAITSKRRMYGSGDAGDGTITYDHWRDLYWVTAATRVWSFDRNWRRKHFYPNVPGRYGKGLAIGEDGLLRAWDGINQVYVFDPDNPSRGVRVEDWTVGGPQVGVQAKTYEKFRYIGDGFFAGISSPKTGFWVYMPPKNMRMDEFSQTDPQALINKAAAGSTVTIPPGIYGKGIRIQKSLTVKLAGVSLRGVTDQKGIINIAGNNLRVVIEDFSGDGKQAGATRGNHAGIRIGGVNFHVTVRRAHIRGTVMGILTDNRGGTLVVEDSLIEELGAYPKRTDLTHGLYAGNIDKLVVRNTTVRAPRGLGHLVKSRARQTTLERVRLIGLNARHSRLVDLSCGGKLTIVDSVLQQGTNTDNTDMIGVGLEKRRCGKRYWDANVTMLRSKLIFDRDMSADEPAKAAGASTVFGWRYGIDGINVRNNRLVDKTGRMLWNALDREGRAVTLPANLTSLNRIYPSRNAAGLRQGDNIEP
jgi:hypothetical protein